MITWSISTSQVQSFFNILLRSVLSQRKAHGYPADNLLRDKTKFIVVKLDCTNDFAFCFSLFYTFGSSLQVFSKV
ncbi:MAG: hypothetical protein J6E41_00755 [Lachnospiraceae bacterium]|nr:hypothetical protein [Lachnospiraceae bacterium]